MTLSRSSRLQIYLGWDPREQDGYDVACWSILQHISEPCDIHPIAMSKLPNKMYRRPTEKRDNQLWDVISDAPMATEFSIARFFVPGLQPRGVALFADGDILVRSDLAPLLRMAEDHPEIAAWCVKHDYAPQESEKMDAQAQVPYARKNWSSFVIWNTEHIANTWLTIGRLNEVPGRDLHRFCWLRDDQIGAISKTWNYLVGVEEPCYTPRVAHFTLGTPDFPGREGSPFAGEWFEARDRVRSWQGRL